MKSYKFKINGNDYSVDIKNIDDNIAEIEVNGTPYQVELSKEVKLTKTPKLVRSPASTHVEAKPVAVKAGLKKIDSPLPGAISQILVKEGDQVKKGQVILMLDAMKMENSIYAEADGVVSTIKVKVGDTVLQGDTLIEIG